MARRLTRDPSGFRESDLVSLRAHGFSDTALHAAVQVVGYFNYINRIADGLGVDTEDFMNDSG